MRLCIIQSAYIPWRGFFDLIGRCDQYVIYDSAQYVKRHWHNRNRIKTANGVEWLTIPVTSKGRFGQRIDEVEIELSSKSWADKHWRAIELAYGRAAHFGDHAQTVRDWYTRAGRERRLTDVNEIFLRGLAGAFGLHTRILRDDRYPASGTRTERLVAMCHDAGATRYLSGPSAKGYLDQPLFEASGIMVEWMDYPEYREYPQLYGSFDNSVSMLDVLFNVGIASRAMWAQRREPG